MDLSIEMAIPRRYHIVASMMATLMTSAAGHAEVPGANTKLASAFGARPFVEDVSLSPDGQRLVFITPAKGPANAAMVEDLKSGEMKPIIYANGKGNRLSACGWSANDRIVCDLRGIAVAGSKKYAWNRIVAMNIDGTAQIDLGKPERTLNYGMATFGGQIVDWLSGKDGKILIGGYLRSGAIGVETVDTRTGQGTAVIDTLAGRGFISDGRGSIRIAIEREYDYSRDFTGTTTYQYRLKEGGRWLPFGKVGVDRHGLVPIAVDSASNVAYALQQLDGRDALYRVSLDGSMKTELIYADPNVDVEGVETIGRYRRVIGYRYITDRPQIVYFDPVYRALALRLSKTLPDFPLISFEGASGDERRLLIFAGSDTDPGHYYLYDRDSRHLTEALMARPDLSSIPLATQHSISFRASDGTLIPAFLTLPPGSSGVGLPAIVMPHGGPASRDVGGFDWLPQYFAAAGFAVLQPEFRGSTGYGEAFLKGSGFKSWSTAVGDVDDAGKWLVQQKIADPGKLAIFGWSYGGYAALQSSYVAPGLFKAVIAVAPVTDLTPFSYTVGGGSNYKTAMTFAGTRTNLTEGSPIRHAAAFTAPVLLFHGDKDVNVDIDNSKEMDAALKKAGKSSRLVIYPGLDHQLQDSAVRADLLSQSTSFLSKAFGTE